MFAARTAPYTSFGKRPGLSIRCREVNKCNGDVTSTTRGVGLSALKRAPVKQAVPQIPDRRFPISDLAAHNLSSDKERDGKNR